MKDLAELWSSAGNMTRKYIISYKFVSQNLLNQLLREFYDETRRISHNIVCYEVQS